MCLDCFEKDYTNTRMTEADVDEISKRWRKLGIVRDLYLDEAISRDFEKYRLLCLPQYPASLEPRGIRPILEESPELAIPSNPNHKYAPDFKARFHQSLCLYSIALATLSHAIYSRDWPETGNGSPNLISERLSRILSDLWDKHQIVLNGRPVQLGYHAQFDCVEISDFLYYFLLDKVIPFGALESWTIGVYFEENLDYWYSLLHQCRFMLQPLDIVDLVKEKTWRADSNFPANKTMYLCERGYFDRWLGPGDVHYPIIREFCCSLRTLGDKINHHESCPWEELRINFGSPFSPGFRQMLDLEASRVESGNVRGGNP